MSAMIVYAEFTAKAGQEETVADLIAGLADDVHAEPGNEEFTVYRERDDPRRFFVFEKYTDEDAFQTHIGAPLRCRLQRQTRRAHRGGRLPAHLPHPLTRVSSTPR